MLDPELKQRAILGNLRNVTNDILNRPRPRAQYIHFWRGIRKKILETLPDLQDKTILSEVLGIFGKYGKLMNKDSWNIANDLSGLL